MDTLFGVIAFLAMSIAPFAALVWLVTFIPAVRDSQPKLRKQAKLWTLGSAGTFIVFFVAFGMTYKAPDASSADQLNSAHSAAKTSPLPSTTAQSPKPTNEAWDDATPLPSTTPGRVASSAPITKSTSHPHKVPHGSPSASHKVAYTAKHHSWLKHIEPEPVAETEGGSVTLNTHTGKYHESWCRYYDCNNCVAVSRAYAEANGVPCQKCH